MATAFQAQGSQSRPSKYAPLFTRKFWTGLYTNGSALGDPATPYLYEKFYSGTRFDHLVNGSNCEVTPQYSLARAPGHSVYNSQTFPAIDSFYAFRVFFGPTNFGPGGQEIFVIADTAANVYDATGPNTKNSILAKAPSASQTFFQDGGNNALYMGDGVDLKKWLPVINSYSAFGTFMNGLGALVNPTSRIINGLATTHALGDLIIDSNNNLQLCILAGTSLLAPPTWSTTPFGVTVEGGGGPNWRMHGSILQKWGVAGPTVAPTVVPPTSPDIFQVRFWCPNHTYGATADPGGIHSYAILDNNGNIQVLQDGTKTTGLNYPVWAQNFGGITTDGTATWLNIGQQVSVAQGYKNNAVYALNASLVDNSGNLQYVTQAGTTAAGPGLPAFGTTAGTTITDGTVKWTCLGTAAICAGGSGGTGYTYYYAWFTASGHFSNLSPAAAITGTIYGASFKALVSGAGSSDTQVLQSVIFRTANSGSTAFAKMTDGSAIENSNAAWGPVTDTTVDRLLDQTTIGVFNLSNSPPPAGLINLCFHFGRIFGSVGNNVFYSLPASQNIGIGYESWAPLNFRGDKSQVIRLEPTAIGLLIHTTAGTDILQTNTDGTPGVQIVPYIPGNGSALRSWNAYARNGSTIYMLSASGSLLSLDASTGVTYSGHPIANLLKTFDRTAAYLTFHEDGEDIGLYVSDGSTGWFRMSATTAPESGFAWSPKRTLAHQCLQSVEITPGVQRLLVGPGATPGPILYRDPTVNKDNGATFAVSGTIGTLVLAQPGQLAEVEFISTICKQVGSHPKVSVLVDELSGTFEALPMNTQESPFKFRSKTLMMDRFYLVQSNQPAKMMYAQIKIDFPAEDARNEVIAYSMWGAHWQEK